MNKIKFVGIPSIVETKRNSDIVCNNINIVYSGSFYEKIRNPNKMLEKMMVIIGTDIFFHLYSWGCDEVIEKFLPLYGKNLILHGRVAFADIKQVINDSDILINLSNESNYQVPGKIMEYYSFGKPVINFISSVNDPGLEEYKKYPLSLNVDLNRKDFSKEDIIKFIYKTRGKRISYNDVSKIFFDSTPDFFVEIFEKCML